MRITDNRYKEKFKSVDAGEVIRFIGDDTLSDFTFMVINDCHSEYGDHANVVCLDDGTFYYADDEETVEILDAELIIK